METISSTFHDDTDSLPSSYDRKGVDIICKQNVIDQLQEKARDRRHRLLRQGFKVFLSSLGMWSMGSLLAFPSVVANDLSQHNTTIFGNLIVFTDSQLDMLSSLMALFSLPGSWMISILMVTIGRRPSMAISGILLILGWLGVVLLPGTTGMLVARSISGVAIGGASVVANTYGIELPDPDVRGIMFIIINTGVLAGQVLTMGIGYNARYFVVGLINLILPVTFLVALIWLPESPSYLVIKGHKDEARNILRKLRGKHFDVEAEIRTYESLNQSSDGTTANWKELFTPKNLKSIAIICGLLVLLHLTGYAVVASNTSRIFKEAGSSVEDSLAALIVTVVQLAAGVVSTFLIDRVGRKQSLILSYAVMSVALAGMATYTGVADVDSDEPNMYGWIPLVCLMISQAGVVLGVNPVPYMISNEYFPTSIRSQASSFCMTVGTLSGVGILQLYSPMQEGLTQAGLYAFYASMCAFGVPYSYIFVKETMGKQVG